MLNFLLFSLPWCFIEIKNFTTLEQKIQFSSLAGISKNAVYFTSKIFKELTGKDELVSFQIGGNPRTICRQRMVEMDKLGEDDSKVSEDPKWQELEKRHKGVFVDGTMVD